MPIPPANPLAPHKVVLWVRAEVREVMPTGEVHGNVAYEHQPPHGGRFEVFAVDCQDRDIAIRTLNELIQELRNR